MRKFPIIREWLRSYSLYVATVAIVLVVAIANSGCSFLTGKSEAVVAASPIAPLGALAKPVKLRDLDKIMDAIRERHDTHDDKKDNRDRFGDDGLWCIAHDELVDEGRIPYLDTLRASYCPNAGESRSLSPDVTPPLAERGSPAPSPAMSKDPDFQLICERAGSAVRTMETSNGARHRCTLDWQE